MAADPADWELSFAPRLSSRRTRSASAAELQHRARGDGTAPYSRQEGAAWVFAGPVDGAEGAAGERIHRSSSLSGGAAPGGSLSQHRGSLRRINTSDSSDTLRAVSSIGSDISEKTQKVSGLSRESVS